MPATLHAGRTAALGIGNSQHWLYGSAKLRIENKKKSGGREEKGGSKLIITCAFCLDQV